MPTTTKAPAPATMTKVAVVLADAYRDGAATPQTVTAIGKAAKLAAPTVRKVLTLMAADELAVQDTERRWVATPKLAAAAAEAKADAAKPKATKAAGKKAAADKPKADKPKAAGPKQTAAQRLAALVKADPARANAVPGYELRWPHGAYDLLKRTDKAPEGAAPWIVRCVEHGTTKDTTDTKAGDALGRKADRAGWCAKCRKAQAAA